MGWEERSRGAGLFGTHLSQGDLNFQAHEMGNQLSQQVSRLLAGRCFLWQHSSTAAQLPGQARGSCAECPVARKSN